jgi:hypothetical protein
MSSKRRTGFGGSRRFPTHFAENAKWMGHGTVLGRSTSWNVSKIVLRDSDAPTGLSESGAGVSQGCARLALGYYRPLPPGA